MRVVPVRFTDDVAAMGRFLEALGLQRGWASDGGGWLALDGSGGGVGLHLASAAEQPTPSGTTSLSYETDEPLEEVAARLIAAGFPAEVVDESWGRSLRSTDPDGTAVQVNAVMTDSYGYTQG